MTSCALENQTTHNAASQFLNDHIRRAALGLNHNEMLVLAALVEVASLIPGEPTAAISRYELADRIQVLSWSQVQRALTSLTLKCLIARRQNAKASGEIAVTVVSAAAFNCFGLEGGAEIGHSGLPSEFSELIVGESEATISAIAQAYRNGEVLTAAECSAFRGGSRRLAQIEFLLESRMCTALAEAQAAAEDLQAEAEREARGLYTLTLASGESLEFDQQALRESTQLGDSAIKGADIRFARDVLERVDQRSPGLITARNASTLAAEILFSRQKGFVWRHDYSDACRVVASVITRGSWSAPGRMTRSWYSLVKPAVRGACGAIH